ncbi:MAG: hypothetical protein HWE13_15650 [Gammaproteobacteria bacterium]|nr:hypothetical protein [Gammaproteobacteria bacterium]NVK89572.1 hypothetical protein [Gammaproteobacteria bacterium]
MYSFRTLTWLVSFLLLSGCVTLYQPVPEGYTGTIAQVADSYNNLTNSYADYFELNKVDGKAIKGSFAETRSRNYGRGMAFDPYMVSRPLPTKEQTLTLIAYRFYSTDFESMLSDNYMIRHTFTFTPKANEHYRVSGEVTSEQSSVWLEDSKGNKIAGSYFSIDAATREENNRLAREQRQQEIIAKNKEERRKKRGF